MVSTLRKLNTKVDVRSLASGTAETEMLLPLAQPRLESRVSNEGGCVRSTADRAAGGVPSSMLAIVASGDGGWRDLDQTIAHELCNGGVSVIGMDSLRYFWNAKSPEQTANDLNRIIQTYSTRWRIKSVALISYSFGADVYPFAYSRLPKAIRNKISTMSLLGFAEGAWRG